MTTPELHRESHDPSPTEPYRAKLSTSSGHPIHPTTSTSTPAQTTVDRSTQETIKPTESPGCWFTKCPRRADPRHTPCCSSHDHPLCHACYRRAHFVEVCNCGALECEKPDHNATDVRPVMPVVARALDLDELARFAAAGDWLPPGDAGALVAEVRRLRSALDLASTGLRAEAGAVRQLEERHAADIASVGALSVAVGKVGALHQPDAEGFCKACGTVGWPCATALAIGAGQ